MSRLLAKQMKFVCLSRSATGPKRRYLAVVALFGQHNFR
jgi:hypothetical protein